MTKQWQNRFIQETGEVIMSLSSPFDPNECGIATTSATTACRRGYVCEFHIKGERCILDRLLIRMRPLRMDRGRVHIDDYPPLNGQLPRLFFIGSSLHSWLALYENIGLTFEYNPGEMTAHFTHSSLTNPFLQTRKQAIGLARDERKTQETRETLTTCSRNIIRRRKNHYYYRDPKAMGYDIVGDIHAHADELEILLEKLGYSSDGTRHPKRRRLIFLGDFIDRGPKNRKVVEMIRTLIRKDLAYAIMGNHEYNAICYHTKSKVDHGKFLRQHSEKNNGQHESFLRDYPDADERDQVIRWFQRLPLFLDMGYFRIVHACWDQNEVDFVDSQYQNCLTDDFLHKSVIKKSRENLAIETLLKGPELPLKGSQSFLDTDKNERHNFRVKWWKTGLKTLGDAAMIPDNALLEHRDDPLTEYAGNTSIMCYPQDAPPVIFGHYSRKTFGLNAACLDYGIIKGNELAALRWHRSEKDRFLSEMEIVKVQFKGKK